MNPPSEAQEDKLNYFFKNSKIGDDPILGFLSLPIQPALDFSRGRLHKHINIFYTICKAQDEHHAMTLAHAGHKAAPQTVASDRRASTGPDVVVIGAGVIGVSCALELARVGLRVKVLDRQVPSMCASYGNAGYIATEQVFPIVDASVIKRIPGMLLDQQGPLRLDWRYIPKAAPWLLRLLWNLRPKPYERSVAGIRALNESSLAAWRQLLTSIGRRELLCEEGSLLVHERDEARDDLEAAAQRFSSQGVALERLSGEEVLRRAPELTKRIRGGLFFPETGHVIDPHKVTTALVTAAKAAGVLFTQATVRDARADATGVRLVTGQGVLEVPRVVLAAGAHSAVLVRALTEVRVPLDTERGYHLMLPRETGRLPFAVTSLERRFIMTPMSEGLRLAGTVEFAGLDRPPRMERAWRLFDHAREMFSRPLKEGDATPWMGFRPSLPDSLPVIDRVGQEGRVCLAFGHHHLGLTQAAITARLVKRFICPGDKVEEECLPSTAPYRLARFERGSNKIAEELS